LYEQSGKGRRRRPCGCERCKKAEKEDAEDLVVVKDTKKRKKEDAEDLVVVKDTLTARC
jgi:hypothetical protein